SRQDQSQIGNSLAYPELLHSLVDKVGNHSYQYPGNEADKDASDPAAELSKIIKGCKNKRCDGRVHRVVNEAGKAEKKSQTRSFLWSQKQRCQYNGDVDNRGSSKSQRDISEKRGKSHDHNNRPENGGLHHTSDLSSVISRRPPGCCVLIMIHNCLLVIVLF